MHVRLITVGLLIPICICFEKSKVSLFFGFSLFFLTVFFCFLLCFIYLKELNLIDVFLFNAVLFSMFNSIPCLSMEICARVLVF